MDCGHVVRGLGVSLVLVSIAAAVPRPAVAQSDIIGRAFRLDNQGQQDEAIALYGQALSRDPMSFDAHYGIARALDLKGNYSEAREHFSKAIELAPDDGSRDQALRMMGVSWTFVGDAKRAIPFFTRVFDRRLSAHDLAGAAEVANEVGRVLVELGDLDGGFEWYQKGFETAERQAKPSAADRGLAEMRWAHAQARIAIRRGKAGEARRQAAIVKSLIDRRPNPDQRLQLPYLLGYIAFYSNEYTRAIAELQQADQQDPFILALLAQAHERTGNVARAAEYYRKVLSSNSHAVNNAFARPLARRKLARP